MVESSNGQQGLDDSRESLPGQEDIFSFLQSTDGPESIPASSDMPSDVPPCKSQADSEPVFLQTADGQLSFVDSDEWWKEHWKEMPEFVQEDALPWKSIYVHFRCREDLLEFSKNIGQKMTSDTPSVWYPVMPREKRIHMGYIDES